MRRGAVREEAVALDVRGVRVEAVLTRPGADDPVSAVLLVPGASMNGADGGAAQLYTDLALGLAARGHAVLRCVAGLDAGAGAEPTANGGAYGLRVEYARAAVAALAGRVGGAAWVLAGHGGGAVAAALLAREGGAAAGVVALSCPSVRTFDLLRERLPLPPGDPAAAYGAYDAVVARLRAGLGVPPGAAAHPATAPFARLGPEALAYLKDADRVDPAAVLADVAQPVLIVHGGRDVVVGEHHAHRLAEARRGRPTEVALFPELQHFYRRVGTGVDPWSAPQPAGPTDPAVAERIDRWIVRRVRGC